jgi:hypothetical protein
LVDAEVEVEMVVVLDDIAALDVMRGERRARCTATFLGEEFLSSFRERGVPFAAHNSLSLLE